MENIIIVGLLFGEVGKQKCSDCHHDSGAFLCLTHKPSKKEAFRFLVLS